MILKWFMKQVAINFKSTVGLYSSPSETEESETCMLAFIIA
jgi:hypothetical protein